MRPHGVPGVRRIAAWLILLACAADVRSAGKRENPAVTPLQALTLRTEPSAPRKAEYSVGAEACMGAIVVTIGWKSDVSWAVVEDGGQVLDGPAPETVMEALASGAYEYALKTGSAALPIGEATVAFGTIRGFGGDPHHNASGSTCRIPVDAYGEDRFFRLLCIHEDGSWERIRFRTRLEFFPGEDALFAEHGGLPYHKKALAFLDTFFAAGSEDQAAYRRAAVRLLTPRHPDLASDDSFWDIYRDRAGLEEKRSLFKSVFLRHVTPVKGGLPNGSRSTALSRPSWDINRWDMLYGGRGSPYVTAFLGFLEEIGKPILSKVIDSELRRIDAGQSYDWRQYGPISVVEGRELAAAALRYLHWGVEYTLSSGSAGSDAVYADNLDSLIRAWVSSGVPTGGRSSNYLPTGAALFPVTPAAGESGDLARAVAAEDPLLLSSPFPGGKGNPIPYANGGIDSPRTFAYKMGEQLKVREWVRLNAPVADGSGSSVSSTAARGGGPGDEYVDERRLLQRLGRRTSMRGGGWTYREYQPRPWPTAGDGALGFYESTSDVMKPFLPGTGPLGASRFDADEGRGPYESDKTAGADCMGLLTGSIAMTSFFDAVLGVMDGEPGGQLDRFYSMQPGGQGLDASGFPSFYVDPWPEAGCAAGGYRLDRDDLERSSVLLADISAVRLGDLLVRDDDKEGVQVGIIVGFLPGTRPDPGQDAWQFMSRVIVLSTDRVQGHAFLSPWAGGYFTAKPKEFQVRRLLKLTGSRDVAYGNDPWELVDDSHAGLQVSLTYRMETSGEDRWIPNTGERLAIDGITIQRMNAWGIAGKFGASEKPVVAVLGPKDYAFRMEEAAGQANLFTNKGGDVDFLALPANAKDGKDPVRIATFHRVDGSDEYRVTPNSALFDDDWQWKSGVRFTVDSDSLVFSGNGLSKTTVFGLRVESMQNSRPGDDFLLRFGLAEKRGADGPYETTVVGTAGESDVAVVYDAPMLWRANLYVDEGAGTADWNNRHPWKDPEKNEWYVSQANGADKDGGQIDIKAWTHFNGTDTLIDNSVAYSLGGTDSVADFNADLMEQEVAIQSYYSNVNPMWQTQENPHSPWAVWEKSSAPGNEWLNYLIPYVATAGTLNPLNVGGCKLYPYRPGYAMKRKLENPSRYRWEDVNYSAGVDCSGLVDRASAYVGNRYELQSDNKVQEVRELWSTLGLEHEKHAIVSLTDDKAANIFREKSWLIWEDKPPQNGIYPDDINSIALPVSSFSPGDIVLFYTAENSCDHIAFVSEVRFSEGHSISRNGIILLEAASGLFKEFRVLRTQSFGMYRTADGYSDWRFEIRRFQSK